MDHRRAVCLAGWSPGEPNNFIPNENVLIFDHGRKRGASRERLQRYGRRATGYVVGV